MTIYYDAFLNGLIPVAFVGWAKTPGHACTGCFNAVIRLKRSKGAHRAGDVLHVPSHSVVEKSHVRDWHQYVKNATLPPVDPANLIPARW